MKIKLSEILNKKNIAIHCDSEEKAKELLGVLDLKGFTWFYTWSIKEEDKLKYKNHWSLYKTETCYSFDDDMTLSYGNMGYFSRMQNEGIYQIIEFNDLDLEN